jgi:UDP-N-acetylmuramate--alanine ligase
VLVIKQGLGMDTSVDVQNTIHTYGLKSGDYFAEHFRLFPDHTMFDLKMPSGRLENLTLGIPGLINIENAVAAVTIALNAGLSVDEIRRGLKTFKGIKRRFDVQFISGETVYIDDYAHHPEEIIALVNSVRAMFPGRKITGIFQPHLFSRTKDFSAGFAESLQLLDEVILLDIYPAREKPVEGVTSALILEQIKLDEKSLCAKEKLLAKLKGKDHQIILTIGAGDIDQLVQPIKQMLIETFKSR